MQGIAADQPPRTSERLSALRGLLWPWLVIAGVLIVGLTMASIPAIFTVFFWDSPDAYPICSAAMDDALGMLIGAYVPLGWILALGMIAWRWWQNRSLEGKA